MRLLDRERRLVLVSLHARAVPVTDAQGRLTGRHEAERSPQIPVAASVSAARGSARGTAFGRELDYDRTVIVDDPDFPADEATVLWIDVFDPGWRGEPVDGGKFDQGDPYLTGASFDGGTFDDYSSGDPLDGGGFERPEGCDAPWDYEVVRVSRTPSYTALAVKRVGGAPWRA